MSSSDAPITQTPEDLVVRFMPPLSHERQRWILETLRRHRARSVLDIGCGEGDLLSVLCKPASTIPNDSSLEPGRDLDLTRVAALDIDPDVIQEAAHAATDERKPHYLAPWGSGEDGWYIRWAQLEVAVWLGRLQDPSPSFHGFDAIVSTEVIEHVPEAVLPAFSDVLLGTYLPRLLLLTTPNYTFNARFHPPGVPRKGFIDPTGQTTRVFRHDDHKREWTVDEFDAWCRQAAEKHGYDYTLGGVGVPTERDPYDRNLGYASQTALFVRRDVHIPTLDRLSLDEPQSAHQLITECTFPSDPRAGHPKSNSEIRSALVYLMNMRGEGELTFSELWSELAMPSGGSMGTLENALMEQGETTEEDTLGEWSIVPPRNPNAHTDPKWDRVVVWKEFQPEPLHSEDQGVGYENEGYDVGEGYQYGSGEEYEGDGDYRWEVANPVHDPVPDSWSAPVAMNAGWGTDSDDPASRWGEGIIDEAAAAAIWGASEPKEPTSKH
ncbi:Small RNA 2'-O-methyltransferase [Rhizoctonia solani AG-1 IB]|uniref:Small RNA 2'-O-methyltransferase n=1 Tax=Thanatephorus cucumeris (strain AG1-IB / isolate 7/3/14) TaxID=1108050 RepID=M5C776_THACB|nr:Small RNA 2'-O-methyltransferase [Rhizoctonia solani AG-1 IB]